MQDGFTFWLLKLDLAFLFGQNEERNPTKPSGGERLTYTGYDPTWKLGYGFFENRVIFVKPKRTGVNAK